MIDVTTICIVSCDAICLHISPLLHKHGERAHVYERGQGMVHREKATVQKREREKKKAKEKKRESAR